MCWCLTRQFSEKRLANGITFPLSHTLSLIPPHFPNIVHLTNPIKLMRTNRAFTDEWYIDWSTNPIAFVPFILTGAYISCDKLIDWSTRFLFVLLCICNELFEFSVWGQNMWREVTMSNILGFWFRCVFWTFDANLQEFLSNKYSNVTSSRNLLWTDSTIAG